MGCTAPSLGRSSSWSARPTAKIRVHTLEAGAWVQASPKLAGLRLNPTTKRLTARQGAALTA